MLLIKGLRDRRSLTHTMPWLEVVAIARTFHMGIDQPSLIAFPGWAGGETSIRSPLQQ